MKWKLLASTALLAAALSIPVSAMPHRHEQGVANRLGLDGDSGHHHAGGLDRRGGRQSPYDIFDPSGRGYRHGSHLGRHDGGFGALRRTFQAPMRFHHGLYIRPIGWYAHRWTFGEFLPVLFFTRQYWIEDYASFGLAYPPPGTVWVRYCDDACSSIRTAARSFKSSTASSTRTRAKR